jgi:Na+/proline symporter
MSAVGQELERTAREGHWIMHDGEVHIGVFCVVCAYMMTVGGLAVWAFYQNRQDGALSGKKEEAYFLAGRSFGWFILFLTMFSSLFSGITVIFVPLEAAWSGYRRVGRWWSFTGALACGPAMLLANYRSVGIARNHKTVAEFFTDRYRSVVFTLIMVFTVGYSAIPYMTAQFVALRDSISVLTGSADLGMVAATAFAYYIFFAEMIGGMRGVALTDAFQTGVMLICYSLLPLVIMYWWGGFSSFVQPDCENGLPGANEYASGTLFCQVMGCNDDGCTGSWSEDAYECTPTWSIKPGCDGNPPLTEKTACDIECTGLAFAADLGTCTGCFIDGTTEITAESVVTLSPGSTLCAPVIAASSKATEACGAPGGYNTSLPVDKTSAHPAFVPNGGGCTGCYGTAARIPWGDPAKFIRYPDAWQGDYMTWKQFGMILNALLLSPQPHFFARWVAARSDLQLKQGMIPLLWAPLLMISVGILVGTVWMGLHGPQFYTNMDGGLSPVSPFAGLMDDLIDKGGFSEMLSTVMMCAAIAAFMSTADSLCIAFSSQLSIDVFQNIAWRKLKWGDATGTIKLGQTSVTLGDQTIYFSKLASFILITVSLADAWDVDTNLSDLFDHFFGLATYGAPAGFYATTNLFGCGKRASSLALILGCLAGYLTYLILFWLKNEAMCKGMDEGHSCTPRPEDVPEVLVGYDVFAAIINFLVATIACYLLPQTLRDSDNTFTRPAFLKWDEPDKAMLDNYGGKRLTYDEAKAIVDRKRVPTNTGGWLILLGCFAFLTAMLPWYDGGGTTGPGRQRQGFFATWGEEVRHCSSFKHCGPTSNTTVHRSARERESHLNLSGPGRNTRRRCRRPSLSSAGQTTFACSFSRPSLCFRSAPVLAHPSARHGAASPWGLMHPLATSGR